MRRMRVREQLPVRQIEPRTIDADTAASHGKWLIILERAFAFHDLFEPPQRVIEQPLIARLLSGKEPSLKFRAVTASVRARIEAIVRIEHVEFRVTDAWLIVIDGRVNPYGP